MIYIFNILRNFFVLLLIFQFALPVSFCSGFETSQIGSQDLGIFGFDVMVFFHKNIIFLFFLSFVLVVLLTLKLRQTLKTPPLLNSNTISQKGIKKVKDLLFLFEEFKKNKPLIKKILLICSVISLICLSFGLSVSKVAATISIQFL